MSGYTGREARIAFARDRRQLEEIADEDDLQPAERFLLSEESATQDAQDAIDALQGGGVEHGDLIDDENFRIHDAPRGLLPPLYRLDVPIGNRALDADAAPAVYRHPAHVRRRYTSRRSDRGLNAALAEPLNVLIDSVRLPRSRLAGQKHVHPELQDGERLRLGH